MKTILIAGGNGFLGQVIENYFITKGYQVKILTRSPIKENDIYWDAKNLGCWTKELNNIEALINLTGKSVDCRYTKENKKLIHDSRINTTHLLGLAVNLCETPPKVWFNSSTATIYDYSLERPNTEEKGIIGEDFSMNIAKSWEKAFYSIENPKTRKIALRTSIVLGKNGGALKPLSQITKFGLGGKQASGKQKVSWIHEIDFARAIHFLLQQNNLEGNFNLSVNNPITNSKLMSTLRKVFRVPFGIPQPVWLIKLGALLIGTEPELVLKSRNVIPERLLNNGFKFKYDSIELALNQLIKST